MRGCSFFKDSYTITHLMHDFWQKTHGKMHFNLHPWGCTGSIWYLCVHLHSFSLCSLSIVRKFQQNKMHVLSFNLFQGMQPSQKTRELESDFSQDGICLRLVSDKAINLAYGFLYCKGTLSPNDVTGQFYYHTMPFFMQHLFYFLFLFSTEVIFFCIGFTFMHCLHVLFSRLGPIMLVSKL